MKQPYEGWQSFRDDQARPPRRVDWLRVAACGVVVASGIVAFAVLAGLAWLAIIVFGGPAR